MMPTRRGLKVLNLAAQPILRTIGKVGGGDVLMILLLCKKMIAMGWLDMLFC